MTAAELAAALGGRRVGGTWMARCPAHGDRTPSLSIRQSNTGKVVFRCFAGCDQWDVIAALKARGLWAENDWRMICLGGRRSPIERKPDPGDGAKRSQTALAIWQSAKPAKGTAVETYLASRGIDIPVPDALRFHAGLKHPSGGCWPVMVALVTNGIDGTPIAVHRTFLAQDGSGKARVDPHKMMLGPCRGGAIRLGQHNGLVMVGEGIETCLTAQQATRQPAWAALSTSGLRNLDLPREVSSVIVLADGDDPGEAAAQDCAWRWKREGRRVRIARPPRGMDFNGMLPSRDALIEEGAQ
jgi:putative DNA primase/helicase